MKAPLDMYIGNEFKTNKHGNVIIIDYYNCHTVIVAFKNTGNIRSISAAKLRRGKLSDCLISPESIMVGDEIQSIKHGLLTILAVESENMVVLTNRNNEEIRMLLPSVQKMKNKIDKLKKQTGEKITPTSLNQLIKKK